MEIKASNYEVAGRIARRAAVCVLLGLGSLPAGIALADSFEANALFAPGEAQLRAEARGLVMIYDGLDNATVERAMDEQFQRIDNMMFVRTRYPVEYGDDFDEEDDCD